MAGFAIMSAPIVHRRKIMPDLQVPPRLKKLNPVKFRYCDLLLAAAERAAFLKCGGSTPLWNVAERPSFLLTAPTGIVIADAGGSYPGKESGSTADQSGVEPPHSKDYSAFAGSG